VQSAFLKERFQTGRLRLRIIEVCLFLVLARSFAAGFESDLTIAQFAPTGRATIPPGTYQESCVNIAIRDGVLRATCQDILGHWVKTELHSRCARDIENSNGQLACAGLA
jgi:hypothetical protein